MFKHTFGLAVTTIALFLSACSLDRPASASPPSVASSPAAWQEPDSYSFVFEGYCGWQAGGRFRVDVKDGRVVSVVGPADRPKVSLASVLTLAEILARAADAEAQGDGEVKIRVDRDDGHPVSVEIDWLSDAIDDEECYEISDYTVGES
jgi:hypothetical protein